MPQQTSTFESHFLTHMQGVAGAYHKLIACSWVPILQVGGLGKVWVNCFPKAITTWHGWESNPRPPDPESDALTTLPRCPCPCVWCLSSAPFSKTKRCFSEQLQTYATFKIIHISLLKFAAVLILWDRISFSDWCSLDSRAKLWHWIRTLSYHLKIDMRPRRIDLNKQVSMNPLSLVWCSTFSSTSFTNNFVPRGHCWHERTSRSAV